jgi:rubrerythrin
MANLSTKELDGIKDQLGQEQLLIKKYKTYSQGCSDPQIKSTCEQIASQHQSHYNTLLNMLN